MWGWRTLYVTSDCSLKLLNSNIHLVKEDGQVSLPIEDIDLIIIESPRGYVTIPLLRELSERGIGLLIVDDSYMPCAAFMPFFNNSNLSGLLFKQLELKLPFKKRIWQKIVKQKILNSALVLEYLQKAGSKVLKEIATEVKSGDSTNRESYAAKLYFRFLDSGFTRSSDSDINGALNYGYAIVRSAVARALIVSGLNCSLGVGHKSKTNPFNLADDFMEVFRPFVDLMVFSEPPKEFVNTEYKKYLIGILKMECLIGTKTYTVSTACWEIAQSYVRAVHYQDPSKLNLPQIDGLRFRVHE